MRRALASVVLFIAVAMGSPAFGQMTLDEARQQGKALGSEKRNDSTLVPSNDAQAAAVPGYSGTNLPEGSYFDDPERLEAAAQSAKSSNEQYRITTDADRTRATFSNSEILSTTTRATSVENDPSTYLAGESMGGTKGTCVPLPPATGSAGYYEASCNAGSKVTTEARTCNVTLDVRAEPRTVYTYYTGRLSFLPTDGGPYPARAAFDDEIASGVCWESRVIDYCDNMSAYGYTAAPNCKSLGHTAVEVKCTAEAQGITRGEYHPGYVLSTGNYWLTKQDEPAVPVVTRAWVLAQLEQANAIFGEHAIGFREAKEAAALDEKLSVLENRSDRDALASELRAGVVNVFLVESLRDVDDPKLHRMGVMWRNLRDLKKKYVIVAASARETTLAHEIGHYLGNDHSYVKNNLKSYERDGGKVTLNADQAARARRTAAAHFAKKELIPASA